ncbi:hypothetical protein [Bacteroides xylanisolvens]|jgi:hypothetical protein|nr:hypothetical protein [Bacteroides xylanisolvens]
MGNDIKDLKIKAEQGDVVAQLNLGILYLEGDGVFQDYSKHFVGI